MANPISKGIKKQLESTLRGKEAMKFDQIRQRHFWSAYFFTADANGYIPANRYTVFTTPVGSNGQGFPSGQVITDRESNWKSQNRVPDNQNFTINEMGCGLMSAAFAIPATQPQTPLSPPSPGAMAAFFQGSVLAITYLTNSVPLGVLADFSQASGPLFGASGVAGGNVVYNTAAVNGFAAPALRRRLKIPILLPAGSSFNFSIDVPRPLYVGYGAAASFPFLVRIDFFATESFAEKS